VHARRLSPEAVAKLPRKESLTPLDISRLSKYWANAFSRRLTLAEHIKDELAQEAALGILRAIQLYKPARGSIVTYANLWAFAMMRKHVNRCGSAVAYGENMPDTSGEMPTFITEAPQDVDFKKRLGQADERTREIVSMRVEGFTLDEIGTKFSISREQVRKIAYRFLSHAIDDEGAHAFEGKKSFGHMGGSRRAS
jgi:RNA polymerase sigma factor (sigma-70 family)